MTNLPHPIPMTTLHSLRARCAHWLLPLGLSLAAPGFAAAGGADAWPEFRGPQAQGHSAATNLPVHWSGTSNVVWHIPLPGNGWSSPVVAGGRIYVSAAVPGATGGPISLHALCLDARTGALLWDKEALQPEAGAAGVKHPKNSQCSATPILAGDRLYLHFGHLGTAALDLAGNILWRQTSLGYAPTHGNGGSPALAGDKLVFSCDGGDEPFVAALDAATGKVRWRAPRNTPAKRKFSFCTPLVIDVDGGRQIILPGSGFVGAYDPADGREIWRVRYGEGYSVVPRPVYAHGLVYIASGFDKANLLAIDPRGAQGDATDSHIKWQAGRNIPFTPSLLAVDGELYAVSDGGIATCFDALTGATLWTERLGGDFSASPFYAEGKLYFLNEAGIGYVLRAGRKFELLARNELGERTLASYAVTDQALFIRSAEQLWRIGTGGR